MTGRDPRLLLRRVPVVVGAVVLVLLIGTAVGDKVLLDPFVGLLLLIACITFFFMSFVRR